MANRLETHQPIMNGAADNYRPDIDGLRALAVGLVLLFHAGLGFPGGFIGVDVFFVISGYLITGIIQRQVVSGSFSLSQFWLRRIRRIVPAATLMTIGVLSIGYVTLLPVDYISLAESAVWQQSMAANIYFWKHTGYFSGPSDFMPLLHTWSLAVEEQFYVVYPLVLMVSFRVSRRWQVWGLAAVAAASFALSHWAVYRYPSATFFLLPTRAWELLVGALLVMLSPKHGRNAAFASQALALAGIACIMLPAVLYTAAAPFPGVRALFPCLGAACVIYGGTIGLPWVNRLLAWSPVVHIGQLSYSLYLWHWPFIVFVRHLCGPNPPAYLMLATLIASYAMSYMSWRFVEMPFRTDGVLASGATKIVAACSVIGLTLGLCAVIVTNKGFPHRAPKQALNFHAARNDRSHQYSVGRERLNHDDVPTFGDPDGFYKCLMWGDSHAMSLVAGLDAACKTAGVRGLQATYFGTAPLLDFYVTKGLGLREQAVEQARAVYELARKQGVNVVILAACWQRYQSNPKFEECLSATIDKLRSEGMGVAVVLDFATQKEDVPLMLARAAFRGDSTAKCGISGQEYLRCNGAINAMIFRVAEGRATVLDPAPFLTDQGGVWRAEMEGTSLYYDDDHLSTQGSLRVSPMFLEMLESFQ